MKIILFLLLFAAPVFCHAQTDTANYQKKIAYCTVDTFGGGTNYSATIDDGVKKKQRDMNINDSKGRSRRFYSRIAILDYMTKLGWTLVSSYGTVDKGGIISFVFERPVTATTN